MSKIREQERSNRQLQLKEAHESSKKRTDAIVSDMTRQYKSTDEELREHQAKLETRIDKNNEEIEALQKRKDEIGKEKDLLRAAKEEETKELGQYIDTMH